MKDLLLYIARSLVEHPDDVTVTEIPHPSHRGRLHLRRA